MVRWNCDCMISHAAAHQEAKGIRSYLFRCRAFPLVVRVEFVPDFTKGLAKNITDRSANHPHQGETDDERSPWNNSSKIHGIYYNAEAYAAQDVLVLGSSGFTPVVFGTSCARIRFSFESPASDPTSDFYSMRCIPRPLF